MYTVCLKWYHATQLVKHISFSRIRLFEQQVISLPYLRVWNRYIEDRDRFPVCTIDTVDTDTHALYLRNNTTVPWYAFTFIREEYTNRGKEERFIPLKSIVCLYAAYPCSLQIEQKDTHILHL